MFTGPAQKMFQEIFGSGAFDSIAKVLKLNPSSELSTAWFAIETIYNNVMVPIALGLMIIWFLVKFMEKSTQDQLTYEQVLMLFIKLLAAKFLIDYGLEIFTKLWSLGISLIDEVAGAFEKTDKVSFDIKDLWQKFTGEKWDAKLGFGQSLGVWAQLLLPWLASKISIACVYFICYSRVIEMLVRMAGAPIALSDFMSEGLQGAGWRYLKNFLAICLQGIIIISISKLYGIVMYDVFLTPPEGAWSVMLMQLSISFAAIALMFKSLTLSKELLGTA